jgi:hypothetical protein
MKKARLASLRVKFPDLYANEIKDAKDRQALAHLEAQIAALDDVARKDLSGLEAHQLTMYKTYKAQYQELMRSSSEAARKPVAAAAPEPPCPTLFMIVPDESKAKWGIPVWFGYSKEVLELTKQRNQAGLASVIMTPGAITLSDIHAAGTVSPDVRRHLVDNLVFFGAPRDDVIFLMEQGEAEKVVEITQIGTVDSNFVRHLLA